MGLAEYYRRRSLDPAARLLKPEPIAEADLSRLATTDEEGRSTLHLAIDGLHCAACVWLIESVLAREPDLIEGRVNMTTRRLKLVWRGGVERAGQIVGRIGALGYRLVPFDPRLMAAAKSQEESELLRAMAVAGFAAGNVMLLSVSVWAGHAEGMGEATRALFHWLSALIALPAIAYAGRPFFRSALGALRALKTNMDVPISIGVVLAAAMSLHETIVQGPHAYFDSAVTLLFFLLIGRYLDRHARGRAHAAAEHLLALRATAVSVVDGEGVVHLVAPETVAPGQAVLVASGERVGVDGMVASGESTLDTSLVTGESLPQPARPGTAVFAGMVNLGGPLRLTVTRTGEGTLLAEIVRLMEAAEQGRSRYVALADRVARLYAPVVHLTALATFLGWVLAGTAWQTALLYAVAVLIITCPCALALAVPAVQVVASGRLLKRGILLKSATALERLARIDTVVFDKTGTLTLGRPELASAPPAPEDLALAAGLARASRHPLAQALVRRCPQAPLVDGVVEHAGKGLAARLGEGEVRLGSRDFVAAAEPTAQTAAQTGALPELWLSRPGRPALRFAFADSPRPDASAVVTALASQGLKVELLSGDRQPAVAALAAEINIATWQAEADPQAKCAHLARLAAEDRRVLMIGDGLNDAAALAEASVSMSPAAAADIAQTAADVVFQGDRLQPVLETLSVARASQRIVRQNLGLAIGYNLLAVPLAVLGLVTPLIAAAAMSASSILVVANALRVARAGRSG